MLRRCPFASTFAGTAGASLLPLSATAAGVPTTAASSSISIHPLHVAVGGCLPFVVPVATSSHRLASSSRRPPAVARRRRPPSSPAPEEGVAAGSATSSTATDAASQKQQNLTIANQDPARPGVNVHISNDASVKALHDVFERNENSHRIFVRACPGVGKSTLALDYVDAHKGSSVYMSLHGCDTQDDVKRAVVSNIKDMPNEEVDLSRQRFLDVVQRAYEAKKTLVIDECHFAFRFGVVMDVLTKDPNSRVIFVSAANEGGDVVSGALRATPVNVRSLFWYPPTPNFEELSQQLARANVFLSPPAVEFMWYLCAAHRNIFMCVMDWVRQQHQQEEQPLQPWSAERALTITRNRWDSKPLLENDLWKEMQQSRGVCVNGHYASDLSSLPIEFPRLLCSGPTTISDAAHRRDLVVHGFVKSQPSNTAARNNEFRPSDTRNAQALFEPANVLLARYYRHHMKEVYALKLERKILPLPPPDEMRGLVGASMMATVLPYMSFDAVVTMSDNQPPLNKGTGLPPEDQYSDVMRSWLRSAGYPNTHPKTTREAGMPDIVIPFFVEGKFDLAKVVIEVVMHSGSNFSVVEDHALRFLDDSKSKYTVGKCKCLVIIGRDPSQFEERPEQSPPVTPERLQMAMDQARDALDAKTKSHDVEIVGILVGRDHSCYSLYVRPPNSQAKFGPFDLPCDLVSRRLVWSDDSARKHVLLQSTQSYLSSSLDPPLGEVCVTDGNSTFGVTPSKPVVWALKDAIKAKLEANGLGPVNAFAIIIKLPGSKTKMGDEDELRANIKHVFEVPPPKQ